MKLSLCRTNLMRTDPTLVAALRAEGLEVDVRTCLERCQHCEKVAIALVDGAFVGAKDAVELKSQLLSLRDDA